MPRASSYLLSSRMCDKQVLLDGVSADTCYSSQRFSGATFREIKAVHGWLITTRSRTRKTKIRDRSAHMLELVIRRQRAWCYKHFLIHNVYGVQTSGQRWSCEGVCPVQPGLFPAWSLMAPVFNPVRELPYASYNRNRVACTRLALLSWGISSCLKHLRYGIRVMLLMTFLPCVGIWCQAPEFPVLATIFES